MPNKQKKGKGKKIANLGGSLWLSLPVELWEIILWKCDEASIIALSETNSIFFCLTTYNTYQRYIIVKARKGARILETHRCAKITDKPMCIYKMGNRVMVGTPEAYLCRYIITVSVWDTVAFKMYQWMVYLGYVDMFKYELTIEHFLEAAVPADKTLIDSLPENKAHEKSAFQQNGENVEYEEQLTIE